MNLPSKLFELQKVANKLYAAQKRIFDIDKILKNNNEFLQASAALELSRKEAHIKQMHVREKEEQEKELQNKISLSEATLYGGMVKNPKELQDLQKELTSLKKRAKLIETEHLSSIAEVEEANKIVSTNEFTLEEIETRIKEQSESLMDERGILEKQIKNYNQEYLVTSNGLPEETKTIFENLFRTKKGKAVAMIEDGSCSICGISIRESQIQQIKSSNQIVYCPSCGRMLFVE